MDLRVRSVARDELGALLETVNRAFGQDDDAAYGEASVAVMEPERSFAAFDGDTIVGGASAYSYTMTVPGGTCPTAGVSQVGVLPTHRRRGLLAELMTRMLDQSAERGEPLAALFASESQIYARFGFGVAAHDWRWTLDTTTTHFRPDLPEAAGTIRFVDRDTALAVFPDVHDTVMCRTPGYIGRSPDLWHKLLADTPSQRHGAGPAQLAVFEEDGTPTGFAHYRHRAAWSDSVADGTLHVEEVAATTQAAEIGLWRWLCSMDLFPRVTAWLRPAPDPVQAMLADGRRLNPHVVDNLWVRVVDLPAALSARCYPLEGDLVLEVHDDLLARNAGRWHVECSPEGADVTRTDAKAEIVTDTSALATFVLGAGQAAPLRATGRLAGDPAAVARLQALFSWPVPAVCPFVF
ncbi:MAG: GNAT family N-acetyltransferase [Acidimicrobiia bacterium]|nr:GNAT family N-acetyltransferase [Acidimicrobiia bacterium]